jgi:hypothetical protein
MKPLSSQQRQEIEREVLAERKISAIKLYREATDAGLLEAKNAVEDMEARLRGETPPSLLDKPVKAKSGCFGILVCFAGLAALAGIIRFAVHR